VVEIYAEIGGQISQESEEDIDYVDALYSQGTADYVDHHFFRRQNQTGTLIVSEALPDHFVQHFVHLRECYALGLFQTVIVYCRAVIETGCYEALRRRGLVQHDTKAVPIHEYSLKLLMQDVKRYVATDKWHKANAVIKKANNILHAKQKKDAIAEHEAFAAMQDTFAVVEALFSGGRTKH
jgi:hypothetical protein